MRKRYVKILTGIAIALVALGIIYAIWVGLAAAKVHRAYAALEKDGRPMHVFNVIPTQVPELENAALLYESAALLLKAMPAPWETPFDPKAISRQESIDREKLQDILGYLSDLSNKLVKESLDNDNHRQIERLFQQDVVKTALWIVEEGTRRPGCRFDRDYEAGMGMRMLNLLDIKNLCHIFGAKALVEAKSGQIESAWTWPQIQLKLANALRGEPTFIDQMVRFGMVDFTCQTIRKLCEIAMPPDHNFGDLNELFSTHEDLAPLVRALDGERLLFGEWVFSRPIDEVHKMGPIIPAESYIPELFQQLMLYRISFKPFFLADHAIYLQLMRENVGLLSGPYSSENIEAFERKMIKAQKHHVLTDMLLPATARIREVQAQMVAQIHITQTGLTLIQYRRSHGAFPETLDVLKIEQLQDPFSNTSLGYRQTSGGFVLYSVGTDGKDNGGVPKASKQKTDYDIVWHFAEPDLTAQ